MEGIAKLFEQSNPLAWVIGAITMIALALVLRNNTLFSENKTFFIVVLAIALVSAFYVASILLPQKVEAKVETTPQVAVPKMEVKTEEPHTINGNNRAPVSNPPAKKTDRAIEFLGNWKNKDLNSKRFQKLFFSSNSEIARVNITGYENVEVGNYKTNFKSANHLTIKQVTYLTTNKYDNVNFVINDNGTLKMTYHVTLTNGYQEDAVDEFSKQ